MCMSKSHVQRHLEQGQSAECTPFDLIFVSTAHHPTAASTFAAAAAAVASPDANFIECNSTLGRYQRVRERCHEHDLSASAMSTSALSASADSA
jgi:hypothetical protein